MTTRQHWSKGTYYRGPLRAGFQEVLGTQQILLRSTPMFFPPHAKLVGEE
jgi:hypothetical protein